MPKAFDACVRGGGRVRTITPKSGVYLYVCWLNGKSYRGELHHKKKRKGRRK
ncbi:MAG TPA: hypothetical protein VKD22_11230 [Ramlibacter sp.]|nr:hypothetical protein [Ramlibacter sp.]